MSNRDAQVISLAERIAGAWYLQFRIIRQMTRRMRKLDASSVEELVGGMVPW